LLQHKELVNLSRRAGEIFLYSNTVFHRRKIAEFFFVYGNSSIVDPIKNFFKPKSVINTSSLVFFKMAKKIFLHLNYFLRLCDRYTCKCECKCERGQFYLTKPEYMIYMICAQFICSNSNVYLFIAMSI
jgi:hypothetical protein